MTTPVVSFFNNKGGVGKTTLVYHLAWMAADLGVKVLVADLDPQANSSMEAMLDDVATETATKLRLLAADAAAAGDESVRRLLVLKVNGTLNELERLKKFAARPKISLPISTR